MTPSIISKHLTPVSFPVSSGLCRGTRLRGPTWHVPYTPARGWCSESGLPSIHRQTASEKSFAKTDMCHDMTKPTKWVCAQQRLSSAWASVLNDQGIHPVWSVFAVHSMGSKDPRFIYVDSEDIRLGGCPGWSKSSLGAQVILLVLSCRSSYRIKQPLTGKDGKIKAFLIKWISVYSKSCIRGHKYWATNPS